MSILSKAQSGIRPRAQKILIYAPEKFGKSTMASEFPHSITLDLDGGTDQIDLKRLTRQDLPTMREVRGIIKEIINDGINKTIAIDTVEMIEVMLTAEMITEAASANIQSIEDFGYGKGYTFLKEKMEKFLSLLDTAVEAGIHVVLLAHSQVKAFNPPDGAGAFDRYELMLSKSVAPLAKAWADMIIFGNWKLQIAQQGKGDNVKHKGVGGRERLMHCNRTAAWDAGNRHGLKDSEPWSIETIKKGFANVGVSWDGTAAPSPKAPAKVAAPTPAPELEVPEEPAAYSPAKLAYLEFFSGTEELNTKFLIARGVLTPGQFLTDIPEHYAARVMKTEESQDKYIAAVEDWEKEVRA